jgi:hypothetical protein
VRLGEVAQVGEGECGPAELGGLSGGGAQPVDEQVEVAVAEAGVGVGGEPARQWPGQPDDEQADVGEVTIRTAGGTAIVTARTNTRGSYQGHPIPEAVRATLILIATSAPGSSPPST